MSSVAKFLFGGSDQKSTSVSGPQDVTPSEVTKLRGQFAETLGALLGDTSGTTDVLSGVPTTPTGQQVAQITPNEQQILDILQNDVLAGTRRDYLSNVIGGQYLPGGTQANPFLQATIEAAQRPTIQALTETLERTLPGRFTAAGQFIQPEGSSAFDRAAAIATRGAAQTLGDIATNIAFGTQEAERGRQQEAVQLGQQEIDTTITNLQAQALPRLIEDLGLERGLEEFKLRINTLLQALQIATGTPLQTVAQQSRAESEATQQRGLSQGIGDIFSFSGTV